MWRCPKCSSRVDDSFDVCWSCGTTPDGVEDPDFLVADDAVPIDDEDSPRPHAKADPFADFAGTPVSEVVECYTASNTVEAKFIADQLWTEGIPASADTIDMNLQLGGVNPGLWGCGPRVRVRKQDLTRALTWIEGYKARRGKP